MPVLNIPSINNCFINDAFPNNYNGKTPSLNHSNSTGKGYPDNSISFSFIVSTDLVRVQSFNVTISYIYTISPD